MCREQIIIRPRKVFIRKSYTSQQGCEIAVYFRLFTSLRRIIVARDFSPSSFKLKRGILPFLTKYVF